MAAAAIPVEEAELGQFRDALHGVSPVDENVRPVLAIFREIKLRAWNRAKRVANHRPQRIRDGLRPVQGATEVPHADVLIDHDLLRYTWRNGTRAGVILTLRCEEGGIQNQAADRGCILDDIVEFQWPHDFDDLLDIL